MPRQSPLSYFLFLISLLAHFFIAYKVPRHDTTVLMALYFLLFAIYVWGLQRASTNEIKFWIFGSLVFRLIVILALPALSDDFYRFIWDGRLLASGLHPFAQLPGFYLENNLIIPGIDQSLYNHLNSKAYFTIYPPLAQFVFWISVLISPQSILGSVVVMRVFIVMAEVGSIFLIQKLLHRFQIESKYVLIYALNPLVIIELTGNLHFEAFVIFFCLFMLYLLSDGKIIKAGISLALAVAAKLLPLIFMPLFLIRLGIKKSLLLYSSIVVTCLILFVPLLNGEIISGFSKSFGLYFQNFEFNASIYYLVREYGFFTSGYNIIQTVGWKLGVISAVGILIISLWPYGFSRFDGRIKLNLNSYQFPAVVEKIPEVMMWVMLFYFLMTTTLHPWYITTLLMLSVFTPYRFVVIWTALIFLTYTGYTENGFSENLYLTVLEYVIVIGYLVYEWAWQRKVVQS